MFSPQWDLWIDPFRGGCGWNMLKPHGPPCNLIFFKMLVRKLRLDNRTIYSIHYTSFCSYRPWLNMLLIFFDRIICFFQPLVAAVVLAFKCEASYWQTVVELCILGDAYLVKLCIHLWKVLFFFILGGGSSGFWPNKIVQVCDIAITTAKVVPL